MTKPKCEEIDFEHCWEDTTPNIVLASMPPQSPPKQRRCVNCGKEEVLRTKQPLIQEWEPKA